MHFVSHLIVHDLIGSKLRRRALHSDDHLLDSAITDTTDGIQSSPPVTSNGLSNHSVARVIARHMPTEAIFSLDSQVGFLQGPIQRVKQLPPDKTLTQAATFSHTNAHVLLSKGTNLLLSPGFLVEAYTHALV